MRYSNCSLMPDSYEITDGFAAQQSIVKSYEQRLLGWFLASVDGNYTFYTSCKSLCELFLSKDADPKNKELIIKLTQESSYIEWKK